MAGQGFLSQSGNAGMTMINAETSSMSNMQSGQMPTNTMFTSTASQKSTDNSGQSVNEAFVKREVKTELIKSTSGLSVFPSTNSNQQNQWSTDTYQFFCADMAMPTSSTATLGVTSIKSTSEAMQFIAVNSSTAPFVGRRRSADMNLSQTEYLKRVRKNTSHARDC